MSPSRKSTSTKKRHAQPSRTPLAEEVKATAIIKIGAKVVAILAFVATIGAFIIPALDLPSKYGWTKPFPRAKDDEVLVIVTDFIGTNGETSATRIYRALNQEYPVNKALSVRIERLEGEAPKTQEDAQQIGEQYRATLVIWGTSDDYAIEPFYEVVNNKDLIKYEPGLGITRPTNLPDFSVYVVEQLPDQFKYLTLFSLGQISFLRQDHKSAIDYLNQAVNTNLTGYEKKLEFHIAYWYLGMAHNRLNEPEFAIAAFDKAITIEPNFVMGYVSRAGSYQLLNETDKALSEYQIAISVDPSSPWPYYNLGDFYRDEGNYVAALENYNRTAEIIPDDKYIHWDRGLLYLDYLGIPDKAVADFTKVIGLGDESAEIYNNRGLAFTDMKEYDNAISDFNKAILLDPKFAMAYVNRGYVYRNKGDYKNAIANYSKAIKVDPNLELAYNNRGYTYYLAKDYDKALLDLERAIQLKPEHALPYFNLGNLYYDTGNKQSALMSFKKFLEICNCDDSNNGRIAYDKIKELEKQ